MTGYWVKTPLWFKKIFPKGIIWDIPGDRESTVYLTFDDGPHPTATPFVLEQLGKYNAGGTFFCVGNNVRCHPEIYEDILKAGHSVGNHTYNHVNGWKASNDHYLKNIERARKYIASNAFRPPYGRIKFSQVRKLKQSNPGWKIYMWDILCGDFDVNITPEQCLDNVLTNIAPGSIIIFHDSIKAWERMSYALPRVLEYCQKQGWEMKSLPM